jgi:hypothetical protein
MKERRNASNRYVTAIIDDIQTAFVNERTISFSDDAIDRVYEFADNAAIKYEWRSPDFRGAPGEEVFNHRFTLVRLPDSNAENFELGVLKVVKFA